MGTLGAMVGSALVVLRDAARLLVGQWPTLAAISLLGIIGHNGFLWFSVWLSGHRGWGLVTAVLLPLVPISSLVALVLMLRHAGRYEATLAPLVTDTAGPRLKARLALLASTLIPFLTLYVAQDRLEQDRRAFVNTAVSTEFITSGFWNPDRDTDRGALVVGAALFGLVAVAFVLRTALDRFALPARHLSWGVLAAYVEVLWLFLLASQVSSSKDEVRGWLEDRRLSAWALDRWESVTERLGPLTAPVRDLGGQVLEVVANADQTIVLPIAWLTVGAVVFGRELAPPRGPERTRRWREKVPPWVDRGVGEATSSIAERFGALARGVRLLAVAGLLPMLLFCVAFLLAGQAGTLVDEGVRAVLGPRDGDAVIFWSPILAILGQVTRDVVVVCLLAAALGRVVSGLRATDDLAPSGEGRDAVPAQPPSLASGQSA
ncbi:hypothetical protein [Oryzobacter terrae]|uniref:hypothetical protein n=1 Tax=Oryzobacter terrae TaxID=1620385 RepID=UPI00366D48D5